MGMPLDLYVIRHGESEANVIINAGEQGDNSLYTQDNVTVPDRSWRLTATGRKQADCIGRWLVAQQQLFDRYLVSPYVRTRETAATMALPKAKWEETRVLRERSWGEINTITQDDFRTNYARNWMFKRTDPLYWRPPAGESIADVSENRVHNLLTSLNRRAEAESVVAVTHGDFMLALMLTLEDRSHVAARALGADRAPGVRRVDRTLGSARRSVARIPAPVALERRPRRRGAFGRPAPVTARGASRRSRAAHDESRAARGSSSQRWANGLQWPQRGTWLHGCAT